MDATDKKQKANSKNGHAGRKIEQLRKDKRDSNQGRQNSKNSKKVNISDKHKRRLECVNPYLTSLPDQLLHEPAKNFASTILTKAIER